VLGAGAAAFDTAVAALDAGANSVDMFMRRPTLPMIDVAREIETAGLLNHGHELPDQTKWALARFMNGLSQAPAEHHFHRAWSFSNFRMHLGSPWQAVGLEGDAVRVTTPKGAFAFDHVFAATGVSVDMSRRPELGKIAAATALWRDRFTPPADDPSPGRLNFPYLNRSYQFTEREPGTAPGIDRIFAFNALASMSMGGMSAVSISSHKYGVPRLVGAITGQLFREQQDSVIPTLASYNVPGIDIPDRALALLGIERPGLALAMSAGR
jgi:cation diffusion facilitator CzcD-associated flavoprotein CzcO